MNQLRSIGHDIWDYEVDLAMPGGLRMPTRSTIVRLSSGALVVHAPVAFDEAAMKGLEALGDVRFVVAPCTAHWMFVKRFHQRFPNATVLVAPGLEKKLTGAHAVPFVHLPPHGRVDAIGDELRLQRIEGAPGMNEHAFLHRASGSLIVTDLVFNLHSVSSFGMRLLLRLTGTYKKTAQSRIWRFLVKDRTQAATSAFAVLAWDFDRVVVAHGDVVETAAREQLGNALEWMTRGASRLLGAGGVAA